jgi:hypothetical protein
MIEKEAKQFVFKDDWRDKKLLILLFAQLAYSMFLLQ